MLSHLAFALIVAAQPDPTLPFEKYQLPNGLTVILSEDHRLPQVAIDILYKVGAANQVLGKSGFAHLFEHVMLFAGAKHIGPKPFQIIEGLGGWGNGWTHEDFTDYIEFLPSEALPTALWIESDRMGYLLDTLDEKALKIQRDVVSNERRQTYENRPYGLANLRTCELMYPKPHPYYDCVIGTISEVQNASMDEVKGFFRQFYVPNNASLAVVGDFDSAQARALVAQYFGPIPRGVDIQKPDIPQPELNGVVRETVDDKLVKIPQLRMVWSGVKRFSDEEAAGDVLEHVLGVGKASRLYRELVERSEVASEVWAGNPSRGLGGLFVVGATAKVGHATAELEPAIDKVVNEVRTLGVSTDEVERAQRDIVADLLRGLEKIGPHDGKAGKLNEYEMWTGDPGYLPKDLARYRRVTPTAVQAFAQKYLSPVRKLILEIQPTVKTAEAK